MTEYTGNDIRQKELMISQGFLIQKAIEKIIDFTWDYYIANPGFKIVHSENQSKGVHYKNQTSLEINHAHLQSMESLLEEGKKHNIFKQRY